MRRGVSAVDGRYAPELARLRASAVRALRDAGWTVREIADVFLMNNTTVRAILHGRTFRNVA